MRPFEEFLAQEASAGLCLLAATIAALLWANSSFSSTYAEFWRTPLPFTGANTHPEVNIHFLVNDVLMAVFFFVVGMEIKREVLVGELARPRQAALPVVAATGGAVVPALIYAAFNGAGEGRAGWGIPMATDIAFAVGIMALLGSRVPLGIKVFLTALAIADDLMAVLVIAVFYTQALVWPALGAAAFCLLLLVAANRLGTRRIPVYLILGIALWYFTLRSGIHSTVAGVALAMTIPARREGDLLYRLEHRLHPWVTFGVMPVFALANAGLALRRDILGSFHERVVVGIWIGLLLGKPIGITLASWVAVKLRWAALPANVRWRDLHGASWLGGIGFTMSLFIAGLAFRNDALIERSKLGIFVGSLAAGIVGSLLLWRLHPATESQE